ncbi:hypothetical protein LAZ67_10000663 [Cordylochernes scorpioides]|uniref:Uncharacterized protein n=1 Tax=Cordylochernes scorpioides TaxID=51811 RepID=A0ABY6KYM1_9ARAC|nr:hypothetical protein LAZ67_10000663 [Cordylochernes scorpioides]
MEIKEFLLVYMVDEEDLGNNRRGLPLMRRSSNNKNIGCFRELCSVEGKDNLICRNGYSNDILGYEGPHRLLGKTYRWTILQLTPGFHRRAKAKTSLRDDDVPIDDTTTKPLLTPQEKRRKGTRDKVPRLRWIPWQKHVRSMSVSTIIASCRSQLP